MKKISQWLILRMVCKSVATIDALVWYVRHYKILPCMDGDRVNIGAAQDYDRMVSVLWELQNMIKEDFDIE